MGNNHRRDKAKKSGVWNKKIETPKEEQIKEDNSHFVLDVKNNTIGSSSTMEK